MSETTWITPATSYNSVIVLMTAFTLKQIAEILADNRFSASHEKVIVTDFSIDSRKVKKGALFIALKGEKFDGHDFIAEAAQQGAVAAIVEVNSEKKIVNPSALPLLFVEESKKSTRAFGQSVDGAMQAHHSGGHRFCWKNLYQRLYCYPSARIQKSVLIAG